MRSQDRSGCFRRPVFRWLAPLLSGAVLVACGGGGGGSDTPAPGTGGSAVAVEGGGTTTFLGQPFGCSLSYSLTAGTAPGTGPDPLRNLQWHLTDPGGNDLRAVPAWALTRGEGARAAIVDDAIEILHEDLRQNAVEFGSFDYRDGDAWPLPCTTTNDEHGTRVAGIVAARDDNGIGVAGVAPRAGFVGYNALSTNTTADIADAMTRGLSVNGVINNSWGSPDNGGIHDVGSLWKAAIDQGLAQGRGGRGTVYVFAGGNGGNSSLLVNGTVDDANLDGYVNKRGVIAVCATGRDGSSPAYAEPGANILVCGPSSGGSGGDSVATTDIRNGYATGGNGFSGTSASAPMVTGTVALMLARNPALTWRDVRLILARTARETPAAAADPAADWQPATALGPGRRFSRRYGFGTVDAAAAVQAAAGWTSVGGSAGLIVCDSGVRAWNAAIPDNDATGVSDSLNLACGITRIEHVELVFAADHTYSADLDIRLTSPSGIESLVVARRQCVGGQPVSTNPCRRRYEDFELSTQRFMEEAASGSWTIRVADRAVPDLGTTQRWRLRVYGR